jgi:hypothetical protein
VASRALQVCNNSLICRQRHISIIERSYGTSRRVRVVAADVASVEAVVARPGCTDRVLPCRLRGVERLNITLGDQEATKLRLLAERMHVQPGTVARSLLSSALDDADPDARNVVELLDGIPDAYERAQLGRGQADRGETISLAEL